MVQKTNQLDGIDEKEKIIAVATEELKARNMNENMSSRFFEDLYELKIGQPGDAARGLEDRMNINKSQEYRQ